MAKKKAKAKDGVLATLNKFQREKVDRAIRTAKHHEEQARHHMEKAGLLKQVVSDMIALATGKDADDLEYDQATGELRRQSDEEAARQEG